MKIGLTAEFFSQNWPGGRERRIYETAMQIANMQNEVHVFCHPLPGFPREGVMAKGTGKIYVHRIGVNTPYITSNFRRSLSSSMLLPHLLRGKFDIINTNTLFPPLPSYLTSRFRKTPIVLTSDGLLWHRWEEKGQKFLKKLGTTLEKITLLLNYDAIITVSESAKQDLMAIGALEEKITVVHNGVNIDFLDSVISHIEPDREKTPSVVFVGTLEKRKGVLDLIMAFGKILNEIPNAHLTIIGKGAITNQAIKLVKELKISYNVDFSGELSYSDTVKSIAATHCLVLPSTIESCGLVILEAMACKKPVIAYDIPALREFVKDEYDGFLVDPGSINHLADKLIEILNDQELAQKMGERGREKIEKQFTWRKTAEKTLEVYHKVLSQ